MIYHDVTRKLPDKEGRYLCKAIFKHGAEYDFLSFIGERWWAHEGYILGNTDLTHRVISWTDDYLDEANV